MDLEVPKNDYVYKINDHSQYLFVIGKGEIEIKKKIENN